VGGEPEEGGEEGRGGRVVGVSVLPREVVLSVVERAWEGWAEATGD